MTRDEAIKIAVDAVNATSAVKTRPHEVKDMITVLAALGVLKLDVSLSEQAEALPPEMIEAGADAVAAFNPEYEEPEDRAVLVYRAMVAAKTEGRKAHTPRFTIDAPMPPVKPPRLKDYLDPYVHALLRCEPPPEHRGKRWHWLRNSSSIVVVMWEGGGWMFSGPTDFMNTERTHANGWRYLAPCLPPTMMELELGERP